MRPDDNETHVTPNQSEPPSSRKLEETPSPTKGRYVSPDPFASYLQEESRTTIKCEEAFSPDPYAWPPIETPRPPVKTELPQDTPPRFKNTPDNPFHSEETGMQYKPKFSKNPFTPDLDHLPSVQQEASPTELALQ